MSEIKTRGIVISSIDFKEKDKLITLYSLDKGLINAKLVGVKNPSAKLKPIKELFCFAEFDLAGSSKIANADYYTVTSANIIENFYNITNDIDKFYRGCTILEILKTVGKSGEGDQALFLETLKALKILAYEDVPGDIVIVKFLIKIFEAMGYQLALDKCASCGQAFIGKRYFNRTSGDITCQSCKYPDSMLIDPLTHSILRLVSGCDYEKLKTLKLKSEGVSSALNLLTENFADRFDFVLRTADKFPK